MIVNLVGIIFYCIKQRGLHEQLGILAESATHSVERGRFYMAYLDFAKGQAIFAKLQLQSAPHIYLFYPTTGPFADENARHEHEEIMLSEE